MPHPDQLAQWLNDNHAGAPYTLAQLKDLTGYGRGLDKALRSLEKQGRATKHPDGKWSAPYPV